MTIDHIRKSGVQASGETPAKTVEQDAAGQFVGTQHGGTSNGVVSAKPTVITGSEDATANKWQPKEVNPPADWDANFDVVDRDKS